MVIFINRPPLCSSWLAFFVNDYYYLLLLLLLFFYNKSVSFFMTRANTNNVDVDRLLFFYTSRRAYFKAHIVRAVIINPV